MAKGGAGGAGAAPDKGVRLGIIGLGLAIVAGVGVLAFSGAGNSSDKGTTRVNSFDLPRLDGPGRVALAGLRGKPVIANFFASWCVECRTELPGLTAVAKQLKGQATFIGIDSLETGDGAALAKEFHLADDGFLLARDIGGSHNSGLHDALGAPGMPATAFYDAQGRLVYRAVAALTEPQFRAVLHQYLHLDA